MAKSDRETPELNANADDDADDLINAETLDEFEEDEPTLMGFRPPAAGSEAALRAEIAAAENRALRAYADLDNYKKRFDRELARQRDVERERFLNVVLGVADNMRRALNVPDAEASPYREGLLTVVRQIDNALRDFGVETITAEKGQIMDPNIHEAITTLTIPDAEHESIVEVVEPGYMMGDRVLRPARVVVAKSEEDD
jgi:molecular chaperone GrpE